MSDIVRTVRTVIPDPGPDHTWHASCGMWRLATGTGHVVDISLRLVDDTQGLHGRLVDHHEIHIHCPDRDTATLLLAKLQGRV